MNLKRFHLFFICCALALMIFLLAWARGQATAGKPWPLLTATAASGAAASVAYLAWFLRRYRRLA